MSSGVGEDRGVGLGLAAVSLRAQAAEVLQNRLVQGHYVPGERLSEAALADELEISRGPIREALRQLGSMGLVRHTINKGWHVPKLTDVEIQELYEMREACESMAGRLAAQRRTPDDVDRLRRTLQAARPVVGRVGAGYPQGAAADVHGVVLSIARNPLLEQRARETQQQLALARYRSAASERRALAAFDEHQQIVEAIAGGQAARAQRLLAAHIRNSAPHPAG
ncbi:MAG: GntR family transcriptional regulator [Mycobacteriales bacterium]